MATVEQTVGKPSALHHHIGYISGNRRQTDSPHKSRDGPAAGLYKMPPVASHPPCQKRIYGQEIHTALALGYAVEHKYNHKTYYRKALGRLQRTETSPPALHIYMYAGPHLDAVQRKHTEQNEQSVRKHSQQYGLEIIPHRILMGGIAHCSRKASEILLKRKTEEFLSATCIGSDIPYHRNNTRCNGNTEKF